MRRSSREVAMLLAVILNRSGLDMAKVSAETIKLLSKRKLLRSAFVGELCDAISEHAWLLFEIDGRYCGAIKNKVIEDASEVTVSIFTADERSGLKNGNLNFNAILDEIINKELDDEDE